MKTTKSKIRRASLISSDMDVVILCGGLGTRLEVVLKDRPKALAEVAGVPFLDHLLSDLFKNGFRRIILAVGHLQEAIIKHYEHDPRIIFSKEESLLGTGGAIKNARHYIKTPHFFVINGDTFCSIDYQEVFQYHTTKKSIASVVVSEVSVRSDVGNVVLDRYGRIIGFSEKYNSQGRSGVNAGIYCLDKKIFSIMPHRSSFSIETDIFISLIEQDIPFHGFLTKADLIDIGTPERYKKAQKIFREK